MRTERLLKNTPGLRLVGEEENGLASDIYGPLKAGLTTWRGPKGKMAHQNRQLSELLSSLEREVEDLNSKYCEAYVTLVSVMTRLAELGLIIKELDTTDVV